MEYGVSNRYAARWTLRFTSFIMKITPDFELMVYGILFLVFGIAGLVYNNFVEPHQTERVILKVGNWGAIIGGLSIITLSFFSCH